MDRPNLLFVFSDQQHWQAAGFEDPSFTTPNLDAFAQESVRFSHAFCTTPQCSPSRSSILTGLYPSKTGVWCNIGMAGGETLKMPTIGAALQKAGYRTAYFGKWHLGKEDIATAGWDENFGVTEKDILDDEEATARAVRFLESVPQDDDRPFALFVSLNDPHDIYHIGKEDDPKPKGDFPLTESWHGQDFSTVPSPQEQFMTEDQGHIMAGRGEAAWQRYRELYREKTRLYDACLGRVLDALDASGQRQRTLTVVTSDHGDMDAEHRLIFKGPFMYEQMVHVPLLIRLPGEAQPPRTCDFMTVNVDLAPTLADFAGAELPPNDGVSLKPLLTGAGTPPEREAVIGQYYAKQKWINPIRMIRTRRYKYTRYQPEGEELYDLEQDPHEIRNLAADPEHAVTKADLSQQLDAWMAANDDPFPTQSASDRAGQPLAAG